MSALPKEVPSQELAKIPEYTETALALKDLEARYADVVFDVTATTGMKLAKEARAEIKGYRTALEKKRTEIKAPALERCRLIDSEATRIKAELERLENPIDQQIKAEEKRREDVRIAAEQAEMARVTDIQKRIIDIRNIPVRAHHDSASADSIQVLIGDLADIAIDESFGEFQDLAIAAKRETLEALGNMHIATKAREDERAELEQLRSEQQKQRREEEARKAEQQRLADEQRSREQAELQAEREKLAQERAELDRRNEALRQEEARAKAKADAERLEQQTKERAEAERLITEASAEADRIMREEKAKREQAERERLAKELEPDCTTLAELATTLAASIELTIGLRHPLAKAFAANIIADINAIVEEINTWVGQ